MKALWHEFTGEYPWIWRGVQLTAAAALGTHLSELIGWVSRCL